MLRARQGESCAGWTQLKGTTSLRVMQHRGARQRQNGNIQHHRIKQNTKRQTAFHNHSCMTVHTRARYVLCNQATLTGTQ